MNDLQLTFNEVKECILATGREITYMIQGEPGIGKTTVPMVVAKELGFPYVYIDMANMSLGDLTTPAVSREEGCSRNLPNEILQLHTGRPVVIVLDEWTKASKEAKNMTLCLAYDRRLGSTHLHPDSIVTATGNATGDGVGDSIQSHQKDRFVCITQKKPTAEEWINNFALQNDIDPTVIAFVDRNPMVMQSYHDDKDGTNPYIFNPRKLLPNFVTPRSLRFASDIVKRRDKLSINALQAALSGAIGAPAAAELVTFVNMAEELPPFASIVANPMKTAIPTKHINRLLLTFQLLVRVEKDSFSSVMKYIQRFDSNELMALFINKMLSTPSKQWSAQMPEMSQMVLKHKHMF